MNSRKTVSFIALLVLVLAGALGRPVSAEAQEVIKDIGQLCLTCHSDFEDKLKQPNVHTPLKGRDCLGCHNPHVSKHKGLLPEKEGGLCFRCHDKSAFSKSFQHKPVAQGMCISCHDPHASAQRNQLKEAAVSLCFKCHENIKRASEKETVHPPFKDGSCSICHDVHSSDYPHQLQASTREVCQMCHQVDVRFKTVHYRYPVEKADCAQCHEPHASDHKKLLRSKLHPPFAARQCGTCHNPPESADPLKTVRPGWELCLTCHPKVRDDLKKTNLHMPGGMKACVQCHNPHGTSQDKLLRKPMKALCSTCHTDTFGPARVREAPKVSTHQPVEEGQCTTCHNPHSSQEVLFLQKDAADLCGQCHSQMVHVSHPMEKATDPRLKSAINCLTCHNPHGTPYEKLLHYKGDRALCVQCHKRT